MRSEVPTFDTTEAASLDERVTWMLPGDSYLFVLGGLLGGVLAFVAASAAGEAFLVRCVVAVLPLCGVGGFLIVAVIGKPPHYASDWLAKLGKPKDFADKPQELEGRATPKFLEVIQHG